ncbi:MAG TPA: M28 family metallopeptidase [Candidatus Thermoplasmatota archaeon]|nr:M28 family metallopeptidase [Candidatus Thermoplasmatota archaeon]
MRPISLALAILIPLAALAGCINPETAPTPAPDVNPEHLLTGNLTIPEVDAAATLDLLREFSKSFPRRHSDSAAHNGARDFLAKELEGMGLQVFRQELTASVSPTSTPTGLLTGGRLVNIIGIHWGTDRANWTVIGGHYDVTEGAHEGAYDDGSGTSMTLEIARVFSKMQTHRTIAFVLFDGEEQGLKGSSRFVESVKDGALQADIGEEINLFAMIDLDMIGLNWPGPAPINFDDNSPEIQAIVRQLVTQIGMPEDKIKYQGISAGRSDYGPFMNADVPCGFFISNFEEDVYVGNTKMPAGEYPFWHQLDTVESMTLAAGGEELLQAGFQTALNLTSGLLYALAMDPNLVLTLEAEEE